MALRKAVAVRILANVAQTQWVRVGDQESEYAAPARQVADRGPRLLVDPDGQELLELRPFLVENAERGIASSGDLACDRQSSIQDGLRIKLGNERSPRAQNSPPPDSRRSVVLPRRRRQTPDIRRATGAYGQAS
jgi:hypothetical protein